MFEGTSIQECDISTIHPARRNPIIADLFHRMKYMETEKLSGYTQQMKPEFSSTVTDFQVVLKDMNYIMDGAAVHDATHDTVHDNTLSWKPEFATYRELGSEKSEPLRVNPGRISEKEMKDYGIAKEMWTASCG